MTFEEWYKANATGFSEGWRIKGSLRKAWEESERQERERCLGHLENYRDYPDLMPIELRWYIKEGRPVEDSMTIEQKEKRNGTKQP